METRDLVFKAMEILDSRGNPTIGVEVITESGYIGTSISTIRSINREF